MQTVIFIFSVAIVDMCAISMVFNIVLGRRIHPKRPNVKSNKCSIKYVLLENHTGFGEIQRNFIQNRNGDKKIYRDFGCLLFSEFTLHELVQKTYSSYSVKHHFQIDRLFNVKQVIHNTYFNMILKIFETHGFRLKLFRIETTLFCGVSTP